MTEKTNIPDVFQESYDLWHKKYIEEKKEWVLEVNNNPFIAIESHIHEDTITDLLAHILETDTSIKRRFLKFLLKKSDKENITVTDDELSKSEIKTQEWLQDDTQKSRLDILIKISNKCFIIIENKIFYAPEQPKQMERYIKGIINTFNTDKENVIAFYATPDGRGECKTAGEEYKNIVKQLAFYLDDPKIQTIYSVLDVKHDSPTQELTQDFCFYLMYRFNNPQSVSFFQDQKEDKSICWEDYLNELFIKDGPSISENINAYKDQKNYFKQLLKIHALNRYLLKEFNKDNCSYHAVFDGIRVKQQEQIGGTDCNVYFETKYYKNDFFMVITIYSLNKIKDKTLRDLFGGAYKFLEQDNNEFIYSIWLWIEDPNDLIKDKKYRLKFHEQQYNKLNAQTKRKIEFKEDYLNFNSYCSYIDFIFGCCMKKIFEGISSKEGNSSKNIDYSEALNIFCGIYY